MRPDPCRTGGRPQAGPYEAGVSVVLHVVVRPPQGGPLSLARDLANEPWSPTGPRHRVIELFEPRAHQTAVDLTLGERDMPEISALLHQASELHLHRIHPKVALRCLPEVKKAVLQGVALVVHGPVARSADDAPVGTLWPGPVVVDTRAAALEPTATRVPSRTLLDLEVAQMLPRACGAVPQVLGDHDHLATICLGETIADATRRQLAIEAPALSRPGIRVQCYDEAEVPREERAARRRAACAYVTVVDADAPHRDLVEAVAQGLPVLAISDAPAVAPVAAMIHIHGPNTVDRVLAVVRGWLPVWSRGEAPADDPVARRQWLDRSCEITASRG